MWSSKVFYFLICSNTLYPAVHHINFISAVFSLPVSPHFNVQILQPHKSDDGMPMRSKTT